MAELLSQIAGDPEALAALRRLVGAGSGRGTPAYTVATLAATLGVTERVVRNARSRGELRAVKRGSRWYIATDAVDEWTHEAADVSRTTRRFARDRSPLATTFAQIDDRPRRSA
ncbi:helix-turn-helix domain-containing protein [Baekduia alba]|uniref:helix-turn-helix domain-containing protein n=1 Tax=Baekduia alba TaxID=2997333 RepID=UPI002340502A|nr:helix-turn-helix domain-containing protein [Baekduia alba]